MGIRQTSLNYFKWALTGIFLLTANLHFAQNIGDVEAFYSFYPKEKLVGEIRKQAGFVLNDKQIEKEVIAARLASYTATIADSVAASYRFEPEIRKIADGDSLLLRKMQSPAAQRKWESIVKANIERQIKGSSYQWRMLLARDFSDRILTFHSNIKVITSGQLLVKETIIVYNGSGVLSQDIDYGSYPDPNNDIQRGIVRDFPTRYLAKDGFWSNIGFNLKSVTINGNNSPYVTEGLDNGVRIMVGSAEKYLEDGIFTYEFTYETNRQIIYHADKDELYWNVNGNGWVFYADSVSCTIQFPAGSRILENACYTGLQGSTEKYCTSRIINDSTIHFWNTARMEPWQGLTVAAAIPKGILLAEGSRNYMGILKDNYGISILGGTMIALFAFYFLVWYAKGRDPKKGTIIPQFEPPAELTPADVGYISEQKYGSHLFAAALVDMAVKKYLVIEHETKRMILKWSVYKFKKPAGVGGTPGNHLLSLYGFRPQDLYNSEVEQGKYDPHIKGCYDSLGSKLEDRFRIRRGRNNSWHGLFVRNDGYTGCGGVFVLMAVIFAFIYVIPNFTMNILAICVAIVVATIAIHTLFVKIMSAYTSKGREIADHIEGFKMYLETAEQKLYEHFTPPEKSLELFEKYLPYAIALKVENAWADKFDNIVKQAIEGGYQPTYYSGRDSGSLRRSFSMGEMSRGISSGLSSTVSSASTPPSSSSGGSSGGGSSGGGGGGGGGGGW